MRFLRVYHESTGPEVHIMQDSTGFNETSSVHIFQDANTVHGDNRSKAKANQSDGLTICKIWLQKEDCQKTSTKPGLIICENELFLACREDVDDVEELFDARLLLAMENTLVKKVKTVAGGPFESIHFCMLEESWNILPRLSIIFQLL